MTNICQKEKNPREYANILSIITLAFNWPVLRKGKKQSGLTEDDIYNVLPSLKTAKLGDQLESKWNKNIRKNKSTKLWKTLVSCFGWTYLCYFVAQLIFTSVIILYQPKVFSKFVAYFQPKQTSVTAQYAYIYGFSIIALNILNILFLHNFSQLVMQYSLKVRTSVSSLLFRKALKMTPQALEQITVGRTITLMTKDVFAIDAALHSIKDMIIGLLQIIVVTVILYQRVGISAFPPITVIFGIIPLQLYVGKQSTKMRLKMAKFTDRRFHITQEALSFIKLIKMYVWEKYFENLILKTRLCETHYLQYIYYLKAFIGWLGAFSMNISLYILLTFYVAKGYTLEAEILYFVQQSLSAIRLAIMVYIPMGICNTSDLLAAFQRIQHFLEAEELNDIQVKGNAMKPKVFLKNVQITINEKEILKSVNIDFNEGLLVLSGNMGCGKTTFLKLLNGEWSVFSGEKVINGTISYAPAEPWIFPSTIKQNIVFGEPYNEIRYKQVLRVCALIHDINQFDKLDETVIGDKGMNLSKGQQARVSLARTIYRNRDIYLIDECLSYTDHRVSNYIFNQCIKGFLKGKICILVSNKTTFIKEADFVLYMENGKSSTIIQQNEGLDKQITYYIDDDINSRGDKDFLNSKESDILLIVQHESGPNKLYREDHKAGDVLWKDYHLYYKLMGGFLVFVYLAVAFGAAQAALSYSEKILSLWVNVEPRIANFIVNQDTNTTEYENAVKTRDKYMEMYTTMIVVAMVVSIIRSYSTFHFCLNAARKLHNSVISALLRTSLNFFESHLIGNVINRVSKDLYVIDEYMPFLIFDYLRLIFNFIGIILVVASVNIMFFIPAAILLIILYYIQMFYIPASRSLRRLEASARSPVIGYLSSILDGLPVVRTCQQQAFVISEFDSYHDTYSSAFFMNQSVLIFFSFLLKITGLAFVLTLMIKILFTEGIQAGDVGLALSQSLMLSEILQHAVKQTAEVENVMTSVERVTEYASAKSENINETIIEDKELNGNIKFSNVQLKYHSNLTPVLKNINFEIEEGNKIGIIGRTGAGKSSIVSLLFHLYDFEGKITIDNIDIKTLNLDFLRSKISIISHDTILFSDTIRSNLDPLDQYSDEEIWNALEEVQMSSVIENLNKEFSDSDIAFSSGHKQLLCLARALLHNNKIIILDEATANLDPETDLLIQKTIKDIFCKFTVLIIAHKTESVMWCDKILIVEDGRIVEYCDPQKLIQNRAYFLT